MILAAGFGLRMRPLTLIKPKPLLLVAGKPLIVHHLEKLASAGYQEVIINHSWLGEQLVQSLGDGNNWRIKITYSPEKEPLETAGGILQALPLLGQQPFLLINGDIFSDFSLPPPKLARNNLAHLVLVPNPTHNLQGDFSLEKSKVKPKGKKLYTFAGISVLSPQLFSKEIPKSAKLAPLLRSAMKTDQVTGELYQGLWQDIGTPEALASLNRSLGYLATGVK